jgi:hypothetical protein
MTAARLAQLHKRSLRGLGAAHQAEARQNHEQPPGVGPRAPAGQGPPPPEPPPFGRAGLACHGSLVWRASRIPEAHPRGQKWASQFAGSCE